MTCLSIVMVLHYLYRAAVSALFSLFVLLIMYCIVSYILLLLFEQIKKESKERKDAISTCDVRLNDGLSQKRRTKKKLKSGGKEKTKK